MRPAAIASLVAAAIFGAALFTLLDNSAAAADAQSQTAVCDGTDDGDCLGVCCKLSKVGGCIYYPSLAACPAGQPPLSCPCPPPGE